ncbi:hypothetical protein AK812_SmicGene7430 [Symbiodinium microadriaticum]|uniref:Uncharacterized protein n=1 Tax=Symbiodinium microadriaticum TaxID=2951 RepID=A0A1Q9ENP5_SYMMI|nr:hypothetical protein AK812_SmicGene7430 [Symbiodinium microadriaticum]
MSHDLGGPVPGDSVRLRHGQHRRQGRRHRRAMTELDVGDSLPPYASEENKKLDAEVKQKQAQIESIEEQLERDGARVKIMTDHLVNVQQHVGPAALKR